MEKDNHSTHEVEESENNIFANMANQSTTNWVMIKTVCELLIEKEIFTKEEFEQKFEELNGKPADKIWNFIMTGKK